MESSFSKRHILQIACDRIIKLGSKHYDFISQFTDVFCPINGCFGTTFAELKTSYFDERNNAVKDYYEFKLDQISYHWDIIAWIYQTRSEGKKIISDLQNINPLEDQLLEAPLQIAISLQNILTFFKTLNNTFPFASIQ